MPEDIRKPNHLRTYAELSPDEQSWALGRSTCDLLRFIVEGGLRFEDKDLQGRIDRGIQTAHRMQTPWFAHEYVMGEDIRVMARADAEDRLYAPTGVWVVNVPSRVAKPDNARAEPVAVTA